MSKRKTAVFAAAAMMAVSLSLTAFAAEPAKETGRAVQMEKQQSKGGTSAREEKTEAKTKARSGISTDEVVEMEILELPDQTKYYGNSVGNYHLYGMELRLTYEDGSTVDVRHDGDAWYDEDYAWYTIDADYTGEYDEDGKYVWAYAPGEQTVELSCGSASAVFSIDILGIAELSLIEAPSCTEYWREIDSDIYYAWDGIVLDAVFSDGSTGELTFGFEGWQLDGDYVYELEEEVLTEGEENVREMCLSVGGKEITFPITQKRVQSIEITKLPTQTVLIGGWKEAPMYGIGLKVVLTDGTSDVIQ